MAFTAFDAAAVSRALAALPSVAGEHREAYFEAIEVVELPAEGEPPGVRVRREEGFAVRLLRDGQSWMASRDGVDAEGFADALRQVARIAPRAATPVAAGALRGTEPGPLELDSAMTSLPARLARRLRERRLGFPLRTTIRRHRRHVRWVGPEVAAPAADETFYSVRCELPGGPAGQLLVELGDEAVEELAERLAERFRARRAPAAEPAARDLVLGPAAAAVLLHEAVAHALEADTVARSGRPEAALGVRLAGPGVHVLDDPTEAPAPLRRTSDDEGSPTHPRWLLRAGVVEQLLADREWAERAPALEPGAGRRADRHHRPGARSSHLLLLPETEAAPDLAATVDEGLWLPEADRGRLDPLSGRFTLRFPYGRRITGGRLGDLVGPLALAAGVADLLGRIAAVGPLPRFAGAGWCAKGGQRLPVWASSPELLLAGVEVGS